MASERSTAPSELQSVAAPHSGARPASKRLWRKKIGSEIERRPSPFESQRIQLATSAPKRTVTSIGR